MFTIIILETPQRNVTLPLLPEDAENVTQPIEGNYILHEASGLTDRFPFVTLWDIMETHFQPFAAIFADNIARLEELSQKVSKEDQNDTFQESDLKYIQDCSEAIYRASETVKLRLSISQAAILTHYARNNQPVGEIRTRIQLLRETVIGELYHKKFYPVVNVEFLKPELFGSDVAMHFPKSRSDIEEAGKCLALNRGTACVFHLMRAMEVAVKAVWHTLGISCHRLADSWGLIIKPMDEEMDKARNLRIPLWVTEEVFFSACIANMKAIKRAWRDTTMHIEEDYNPEQAETVYRAIEGTMKEMAKRIDENGNMH